MGWLLAAGIVALGSAPVPPIEVEVQGPMEVDLQARVGRGRGEVRIVRGAFRVCCQNVELAYDDGGVARAVCSGRVVVVYGEKTRGTADRVRYAGEGFVLEGNVRLWTGGGVLTGEQLTYDARGERVRLVGHPTRWSRGDPPADLEAACPGP